MLCCAYVTAILDRVPSSPTTDNCVDAVQTTLAPHDLQVSGPTIATRDMRGPKRRSLDSHSF